MNTKPSKNRAHGRLDDALRPLNLIRGPLKFAEGSAQIEFGDTRVLIAATLENRVPPFLIDSGTGWVTAEYSMLPRATLTRNAREVNKGRQGGRTHEIQRLIGRSLRAAIDPKKLGERTLTLDCDVLQADGGTRTASITGAYVALVEALAKAFLAGDISEWPVVRQIAAISVGMVEGRPVLDLDYVEDSSAEVDLNVVAGSDGQLIEVQGTGEKRPFSRQELDAMIDLALSGIAELYQEQNEALALVMAEVDEVRQRGRRRTAARSERSVWGRPAP